MEKIGNIKQERKIFKSRVIFSAIIMLAMTLILIIRLFNLQITQHDYYLEEALGNQMQNLPITPIRGDILDRNGKILATNEFSYRLTIIPEKVVNLNNVLIELEANEVITYDEIKKFKKTLGRYKKFHNVPIKFNLTEYEVASFLVSNQQPGIEVESYFQRVYPYGKSSAHLIGYVSSMNKNEKEKFDKKNYSGTNFIGKTGIEKQYEELLHGQSGIKQIERNVAGRIIDTKVLIPSVSGQDIYLNIDIRKMRTFAL